MQAVFWRSPAHVADVRAGVTAQLLWYVIDVQLHVQVHVLQAQIEQRQSGFIWSTKKNRYVESTDSKMHRFHTIGKTDVDALLEAPAEGFVDVPRMIGGRQHHDDFALLAVHKKNKINEFVFNTKIAARCSYLDAFRPSIWISSSALNRRLASCSVSVPRLAHSESISSMKIVLGAWWRAYWLV